MELNEEMRKKTCELMFKPGVLPEPYRHWIMQTVTDRKTKIYPIPHGTKMYNDTTFYTICVFILFKDNFQVNITIVDKTTKTAGNIDFVFEQLEDCNDIKIGDIMVSPMFKLNYDYNNNDNISLDINIKLNEGI